MQCLFCWDLCPLALGRCRSAQALAAAEAEHAAAERRQELFVLLRNAAKVFPEEGYAVVGPRLQALASEGDTDFKVLHSAFYSIVQYWHLAEALCSAKALLALFMPCLRQ